MRYAVLTDIHANIFALKAVMDEVDKLKPDKIICLGDIVGNGTYPEETVQYIRKRGDILCVKGNHDLFANLDLKVFPVSDTRIKMFEWTQKALSKSSKKFLSELPNLLIFNDCGKKIVCFHYPQRKNLNRFKDLIYLPSDDQVRELFEGLDGDIFLFGHEHTGSLTELDGKFFLNFGTLGNMLFENEARFGIVDVTPEKVVYKLIIVNYDDSTPRKRAEEINAILNGERK